jgi:deazaflavin-dependent oxidoreductase (nitroreductase family)
MVSPIDRGKNLFPSLVLRSPLHALMSGRFMIIEFTGRKSGRRYATPVAYVREGDRLLLSTDSPWWRNLAGGAPVRVRLQGRDMAGTGTAVTDPEAAAVIIRRLVDAIPSYYRPAGLVRDGGRVSDAEIGRAVATGRVGIQVDLEQGA